MYNMNSKPGYSHCIKEPNNTNLDQQHHAEDAGALALGQKQQQKTYASQALAKLSLYDNNIPLLIHNMTTVPRAKHCIQEHNNTNLNQQRHTEDASALSLDHKQPQKTYASQALAQPNLYDRDIPLLMNNMTTVPRAELCIQEHNNTNLDQQRHAEDASALALGQKQPQKSICKPVPKH
jgi:hypothetical protein